MSRKCLENEKPCPNCSGILYKCSFEDGEEFMVCDMCAHEEKIKEADNVNTKSGCTKIRL